MQFQFRHVARLQYPTKHVLVCEDDIAQQLRFCTKLRSMLDPQGIVQISLVPGGLMAAAIMSYTDVDLLILDHDMPLGNGSDLLTWMTAQGKKIPVLFASGIKANNVYMATLYPDYLPGDTMIVERSLMGKETVLDGTYDRYILTALGFE